MRKWKKKNLTALGILIFGIFFTSDIFVPSPSYSVDSIQHRTNNYITLTFNSFPPKTIKKNGKEWIRQSYQKVNDIYYAVYKI